MSAGREPRRLSWDEPAPADFLDSWLEGQAEDELEENVDPE